MVPVNRLANIYAESKEYLTVKQHLDHRLKVAINEPVGETPEFATNFLWQVNFFDSYIDADVSSYLHRLELSDIP